MVASLPAGGSFPWQGRLLVFIASEDISCVSSVAVCVYLRFLIGFSEGLEPTDVEI